nr:9658_t:CDS:10 [Entrophospora candida]
MHLLKQQQQQLLLQSQIPNQSSSSSTSSQSRQYYERKRIQPLVLQPVTSQQSLQSLIHHQQQQSINNPSIQKSTVNVSNNPVNWVLHDQQHPAINSQHPLNSHMSQQPSQPSTPTAIPLFNQTNTQTQYGGQPTGIINAPTGPIGMGAHHQHHGGPPVQLHSHHQTMRQTMPPRGYNPIGTTSHMQPGTGVPPSILNDISNTNTGGNGVNNPPGAFGGLTLGGSQNPLGTQTFNLGTQVVGQSTTSHIGSSVVTSNPIPPIGHRRVPTSDDSHTKAVQRPNPIQRPRRGSGSASHSLESRAKSPPPGFGNMVGSSALLNGDQPIPIPNRRQSVAESSYFSTSLFSLPATEASQSTQSSQQRLKRPAIDSDWSLLRKHGGADSLLGATDATEKIVDNSSDGTSSTIQQLLNSSLPLNPKQVPGSIYSAVYSGITVYEYFVKDVVIMRRCPDSYLNATQILKVAGMDKSKRAKIIEKEILTGIHEKVQGGYGKYQGTWIPFERGKELATKYGVLETLRPLFEYKPPKYDIPYLSSPHTPNKTNERSNKGNKITLTCSEPASESATVTNSPPPEIDEGERLKNILMTIFLNEEPESIPDLLVSQNSSEPDINMVIDSHGNSAIHWAACLGRVNILEILLNRGANLQQVNYDEETALTRSVFVTNNCDSRSFPQVVKLLHDTIPITDKNNRSVFHHIAMSSGVRGHAAASKYYMGCLAEWFQSNVCGFLNTILDIQDKNGDTALCIAARVGDNELVEKLIKMGANVEIQNKLGLKPSDFDFHTLNNDDYEEEVHDMKGVREDMNVDMIQENVSDFFSQSITPFTNDHRKSREVVSALQTLVEDAENEWVVQLKVKEDELFNVQSKFNDLTRQLVDLKRSLKYYRQNEKEYNNIEEYLKFLEQVLVEVEKEENDVNEYSIHRKSSALASMSSNQQNNIYINSLINIASLPPQILSQQKQQLLHQPRPINSQSLSHLHTHLRIKNILNNIMNSSEMFVDVEMATSSGDGESKMSEKDLKILQAQLSAYQIDKDLLQREIERLQEKSLNAELQYKQIISTCCKIDLDKVDDLVETILEFDNDLEDEFSLGRIGEILGRLDKEAVQL